jgi:hypothetical protein
MVKMAPSFVLSGHCRLTVSAAFTRLPRFIQRGATIRGSTYQTMYDSPLGHWALTISHPSADVTFLIRRVPDLAAALLDTILTILMRGR